MTSHVVTIVSACTAPSTGRCQRICSPRFSCTKVFSFYFRSNACSAPTANNANGRKKPAKYQAIDHHGPCKANATGTILKTPIRRKLLKTKSPTVRFFKSNWLAAAGQLGVEHPAQPTGCKRQSREGKPTNHQKRHDGDACQRPDRNRPPERNISSEIGRRVGVAVATPEALFLLHWRYIDRSSSRYAEYPPSARPVKSPTAAKIGSRDRPASQTPASSPAIAVARERCARGQNGRDRLHADALAARTGSSPRTAADMDRPAVAPAATPRFARRPRPSP